MCSRGTERDLKNGRELRGGCWGTGLWGLVNVVVSRPRTQGHKGLVERAVSYKTGRVTK